MAGEFRIEYEDLVFGPEIGHGEFGKVWKGKYQGAKVAIKELLYVDNEAMRKYIEREMKVLMKVFHPNIVQLMGLAAQADTNQVFIIMEFVEGGSLRSVLANQKVPLNWYRRISFARDIALAMNYLHHRGIMHRDLKSENLLLGPEWKLVLCDFGLSREMPKEFSEAIQMTSVGTTRWMAPEVALKQPYASAADVFSYGMVLYELLTRERPPKRDWKELYAFKPEKFVHTLPKDTPREFWDLVCQCTAYEPEDRPTFEEVLKLIKPLKKKYKEQKESSDGSGKSDEDPRHHQAHKAQSLAVLSPNKNNTKKKDDSVIEDLLSPQTRKERTLGRSRSVQLLKQMEEKKRDEIDTTETTIEELTSSASNLDKYKGSGSVVMEKEIDVEDISARRTGPQARRAGTSSSRKEEEEYIKKVTSQVLGNDEEEGEGGEGSNSDTEETGDNRKHSSRRLENEIEKSKIVRSEGWETVKTKKVLTRPFSKKKFKIKFECAIEKSSTGWPLGSELMINVHIRNNTTKVIRFIKVYVQTHRIRRGGKVRVKKQKARIFLERGLPLRGPKAELKTTLFFEIPKKAHLKPSSAERSHELVIEFGIKFASATKVYIPLTICPTKKEK